MSKSTCFNKCVLYETMGHVAHYKDAFRVPEQDNTLEEVIGYNAENTIISLFHGNQKKLHVEKEGFVERTSNFGF